jgi:hypothetical protein
VLRSVRSCILRERDDLLGGVCSGGVDWQELQRIAIQNKLAVLVLRGLNRSGTAIPSSVRAILEENQRATVQRNTINLMTLRQVLPSLEASGVNAIVLKGPVSQQVVHRDFFSKPSTDLDLLVSPNDYAMASRLVESNGFSLAEECSSPWWSIFLGEQHFLSSVPSQATIDLHYRTQQPGSPAPRHNELFISQSVRVSVGGIQVRTLSETNTCLLSCMSLVKALIHREPAGGHVCDIAANIHGYGPNELRQLFDDASRQGLCNNLVLGLRSAGVLFGVQVQLEKGIGRSGLREISEANLLRMILSPHSSGIRWPRRSKMLWELCDSKRAYLQAIYWKLGGELCRRLYERPRRVQVATVRSNVVHRS